VPGEVSGVPGIVSAGDGSCMKGTKGTKGDSRLNDLAPIKLFG